MKTITGAAVAAAFACMLAPSAQAALQWVPAANGQVPPGAVIGGAEPGRQLPVCRAPFQNGIHPGKLVARNCNIGWGGKEITIGKYEVLVAPPAEIRWLPAANGQVPPGAVIGGKEPGRQLPVCRAPYQNGMHPGKLVAKNCNIGWGGKEITLNRYEVMVAVAAAPVPGPVAVKPAAGVLYTTMAHNDQGSYGFKSGSTYVVNFVSQIDTFPTELGVRMGSNQNPYDAAIKIAVNGKPVFAHSFTGLKQRQSDWATVFPIRGIAAPVKKGDRISIAITPAQDTGIAALTQLKDPNAPPSPIAGYGPMTARFYFNGSAQPDRTAYPKPKVDLSMFQNTIADGGSNWALGGGASFTQTFISLQGGVPKELGVKMGINQNPYNARVQVSVNGAPAFDKTFTGLRQRQSDRATVFALDGFKKSVKPGDKISFTVTPATQIGIAAIHFDRQGIEKGTVPRYGAARSAFYMKK
jgi:hypothetical protein